MEPDIMQLMEDSASLIDLEERLKNDFDQEFPNLGKYLKWLNSKWTRISSDRVNKVLRETPTEAEFPTLVVESEGIEYHLHGIVHGDSSGKNWNPKQNIKDYINKAVDTFNKPMEGEAYLYEQNLHHIFDFDKDRELKYRPKDADLASCLRVLLLLPFTPLGLAIKSLEKSGAYLYSKTIKNPKGKVKGGLYLIQRALTDEKSQGHYLKFQVSQEMPQPFNLEMQYLLEKESLEYRIFSFVLGNNNLTKVEDDLEIVNQLINYPKFRDKGKLHHIGGAMHTTRIAYFLQNPEYSFERLEEYRTSKKET